MKLTRSVFSAIIGAFLTVATGASAADTVFHGSLCNPQPGDVSKIEYGQFGVDNTSGTTANVACGANTPILALINTVEIETYDRNAGTDIFCSLFLTDIVGATIFSQTKNTTSSGPSAKLLSYSPGTNTHTLMISCSLPANSGGNVSHIATYRVITP